MRILITGASSGLGEEMARQFAAAGHDLALCARRTDRLEVLKTELSKHSGRISIKALDVTEDAAVFKVFADFATEFGGLDRVIVNAGLGKGQPLGTGRYDANKETAMTNFIGALAQTEAALEIFRKQNSGHLVMVSSFSAFRGLPKNLTTYAATKAGVAHLIEGLRVELANSPIKTTVLYPGYIESEMSAQSGTKNPLMATTSAGVRSMIAAIEAEKAHAVVPGWPWRLLAPVIRRAPIPVLKKLI